MSLTYLVSDNGKLTCSNEKFLFVNKDKTTVPIFPFLTDGIVVSGKVNITGDALRMLMKNEISVFFASTNGKYNGRLAFGEAKNVNIRNAQHLASVNNSFNFNVAKSIVNGKIRNQIRFLERKNTNQKLNEYIADIKEQERKLKDFENIDQLRGIEGYSSKIYFSAFKEIFPKWTGFSNRQKNPPKDCVNSVLSFLYTLLSYRVEMAIIENGLDPAVGCLHEFCYSRNSLVFDLMEEFRSPIADTVACSLFNLKILSQDDFYTVSSNSGESESDNTNKYAVYISKDGIKKLIGRFEHKMSDSILLSDEESPVTYDEIIRRQVRQYKKAILSEEEYSTVYFK